MREREKERGSVLSEREKQKEREFVRKRKRDCMCEYLRERRE